VSLKAIWRISGVPSGARLQATVAGLVIHLSRKSAVANLDTSVGHST